MKKIIFSLFVLTYSLYAFSYDAKFYVGVGGGVQYESFTSDEEGKTNSPALVSLKVGYGDRRAYSVEFVINAIDNKSNIFSKKDGRRYGMDVMFVKAFNLSEYFYPLVRAGFGAGEMHVDNAGIDNKSKLAYSSFNIGAGAFFPISTKWDIEANYEYRFTSYQSYLEENEHEHKAQSHINQIYVGVNYRF